MEIAILIVGLLVLAWFRMDRQARRVSHLRALELSRVTGIPSEQIEREIVQRRITPGDWAREHGLDPLTFRTHQSSPARTAGERAIAEPDWSEVADLIPGGERQIASCSGWTVSLTDPVDHPVSLYLTDAALYVAVKPETVLPKEEIRRWPKSQLVGCDTAPQPDGGRRLMLAFKSDEPGPDSLATLGVDLRQVDRASEFADHVVLWFNEGAGASSEGAHPPPRPAPAKPLWKKGRLPTTPKSE